MSRLDWSLYECLVLYGFVEIGQDLGLKVWNFGEIFKRLFEKPANHGDKLLGVCAEAKIVVFGFDEIDVEEWFQRSLFL